MIYVLAYPVFAPATAVRIDTFRAAHEPARAKLVAPHITLVFGLRRVQAAAFIEFCQTQIGSQPSLPITFDGSEIVHDPFEATHKIVLTCATGRAALHALHQSLYDGPHAAELDPSIPYRPHMTVATNRDRAALDRLDIRALGPFPISGTIQALDVVEHRGDVLVPHARLPLGS